MTILTTRANFDNTNRGTNGQRGVGGLNADTAGDLSGTTALGGANDDGTVFDIASMDGSHASAPITLVSFNSTNGPVNRVNRISLNR